MQGATKLSVKQLIYTFLIWCTVCMALQAYALVKTFSMDPQLALKDAAITNMLIALSGYAIISMMRFYNPGRVIRYLISLVFAALCVISTQQLLPQLVSNDTTYLAFVSQSEIIRALYTGLMITVVTIFGWLWFLLKEQQETHSRNTTAEQLAREAELSRLRQQLQPHFLFNSLNSISALAGTKPELARKMIQQLSDFLRGTLKKDDQQLVSLSEELEHLELYLDIEKVRFGHRLQTEMAIEDKARSAKLPTLLLQPVVENAIKFGLYDTTGATTIRVSAILAQGFLVIQVDNPFDAQTHQSQTGTGFGLTSVQRRLYLLYGRQDLVSTRQEENRFITELKIPL